MAYKTLILGASYGSLLGTKLLMAGHDVTLVCRSGTAALINQKGTEVRMPMRGEEGPRVLRSTDMPGRLDAKTPEEAQPGEYDLVCLAMQEPQYGHASVLSLLERVAKARVACMSIMNMPPPPYLARISGLDVTALKPAYTAPDIWDGFDPALVTLCSPDPQAFRPEGEGANVLQVGLPTNFKVALFDDAKRDEMLGTMARDIDALRLDGQDVPVKLRTHASIFVPLAKWSMLAAGNYRCVTETGAIAIRDAVTGDRDRASEVYGFVNEVVTRLGGDEGDMVPFEKYAAAAENLKKPSSAARAIESGSTSIERVDKLIQLVARTMDMRHPVLDATVETVDGRLARAGSDAA